MPSNLEHIIATLARLEPASCNDMVALFTRMLSDCLLKTIDTHNTKSIIFIFECDSAEYVLKAEYGSNTATSREISWYKRLLSKQYIAPTLHYSIQNNYLSFLVLSCLSSAQTLDEICFDTAAEPSHVTSLMNDALKKVQDLYDANLRVPLSKQMVSEHYTLKYNHRRNEAMNVPFLAELFRTESFTINGKSRKSVDYYIEHIQKDARLCDYLTPDEGGTIHGDLHFGNILCLNGESLLIDPNGHHPLPFEYDLGKLLHSVHGNFGGIMRGRYTVNHFNNEYALHVERPAHFEDCLTSLKKMLDTQTLLRGLYSEAMHFATMLPHHATEKGETLALFLTCIDLFGELFELLEMPVHDSAQRSQYV